MSELELFTEALNRTDPAERAAFLDEACAGNPGLRRRLEQLLDSQPRSRSPLDRPPVTPEEFIETANLATALATGEHRPDEGSKTLSHADPNATTDVKSGARTPPTDATGDLRPDRAAATIDYSDHDPTTPSASKAPSFRAAGVTTGEGIGTIIAGRYALVDVIGEGGMGSVYLAEQSEPVKRQVALKLIKNGMDSRGVLARFDAERQALAMMDHPNIARIYDGGLTPAGQPFFVMELVKGVSLTEYCDHKRLPVKARLELFVAVCQAVQHAHQKGIIHRDLKPGNVLVTEVDGRPMPKVIDFGVAKAIEVNLTDMSFADTGAVVGTPTYMSPEQADPSSMDVDTRTDVYSLGVMLYELLTGSPPLDARQFKRGAILEMLRMVREVDPPKPSTKVSAADALPSIAASRDVDPAQLKRALQGDLDWIVMMALEKDRIRRYETANGFAADILRHLAYEPVAAAPPSRAYRLRKYVRKHRGAVTAASLVLLSLLGGLVAVAVVQTAANKALSSKNHDLLGSLTREALANRELVAANQRVGQRYLLAMDAIKTYYTGVSEEFLLKEKNFGGLRKKLLGSARSFYTKLEDQIKDQEDRDSRKVLANAYLDVGKLTREIESSELSIVPIEKAVALQRTLVAEKAADPDAQADLAESLLELSICNFNLGRISSVLAPINEAVELLRAIVRPYPDVERYQASLGMALQKRGSCLFMQGSNSEALASFEEGERVYKALVKAKPSDHKYQQGFILAKGSVAVVYGVMGNKDKRTSILREALIDYEKLASSEPDNPEIHDDLAKFYLNLGGGFGSNESEKSLIEFQRAESIWQKLTDEYPNTLAFWNNLGFIRDCFCKRLSLLGRTNEEQAAYRSQGAAYEHAVNYDPLNPLFLTEVAYCHELDSILLARSGRNGEALAGARKALEIRQKIFEKHPKFERNRLEWSYRNLGDIERANGLIMESKASYGKWLGLAKTKVDASGAKPGPNDLRSYGVAMVRTGQIDQGLATIRRALVLIGATKPQTPETALGAARCEALLVEFASELGSGISADDSKAHAARALEDLRNFAKGTHASILESLESGYFDIDLIDKEPDLASIRENNEYQKLLAELRTQKQ